MCILFFIFFFKQKTAYEMRISDWSSDVCSSDLTRAVGRPGKGFERAVRNRVDEAAVAGARFLLDRRPFGVGHEGGPGRFHRGRVGPVEQIDELDLALMLAAPDRAHREAVARHAAPRRILEPAVDHALVGAPGFVRSEE